MLTTENRLEKLEQSFALMLEQHMALLSQFSTMAAMLKRTTEQVLVLAQRQQEMADDISRRVPILN